MANRLTEEEEEDWSLHIWQLPLSMESTLGAAYKSAQMRHIAARHGQVGLARRQEVEHYRQYCQRQDGREVRNREAVIMPAIQHRATDCLKWRSRVSCEDMVEVITAAQGSGCGERVAAGGVEPSSGGQGGAVVAGGGGATRHHAAAAPPIDQLRQLADILRNGEPEISCQKKVKLSNPAPDARGKENRCGDASDHTTQPGPGSSAATAAQSYTTNDNNAQLYPGSFMSKTLTDSNRAAGLLGKPNVLSSNETLIAPLHNKFPDDNSRGFHIERRHVADMEERNKESQPKYSNFSSHSSGGSRVAGHNRDAATPGARSGCGQSGYPAEVPYSSNRGADNCYGSGSGSYGGGSYGGGSGGTDGGYGNGSGGTDGGYGNGSGGTDGGYGNVSSGGYGNVSGGGYGNVSGGGYGNVSGGGYGNSNTGATQPRGGSRGRGLYPWQRGRGSSTANTCNSSRSGAPVAGNSDFKTASHQLLLNQAKQGKGSRPDPNTGWCGPGRREADSVQAGQYGRGGGGERRSLGARPGVASSKFVPPVRREDGTPTSSGEQLWGDGTQGEPGPYDEMMADPRLKNIDSKMVEMVMNEVLDTGLDVGWDDIAGLLDAKATIQEVVVWPMLRPDIFTGLRGPPKGVLLFGPPGTGKTMIGKAIASQSGATFFCISASCLTSKWVGEGEKMVRALFAVARVQSPSVIFIDEIDSLLSQRNETEHESSRRIKTEFLVQLDGVGALREQVLVVGATNRPHELDEAARRRLVKRLYIPLPDTLARGQLIEKLLTRQRHTLTAADMAWVAERTDGYSGADVAAVCSEAAMGPIRGISPADMRHISLEQVRDMNIEDFRLSVRNVRPSVCADDLSQYHDWNLKYGLSRVRSAGSD